MVDFLSVTIGALLMAGLYAAMSYGLALIYGVMKIINLAHAGIMMLGAFVSYTLFAQFGLDPFPSMLITFPLFFLMGVGMHVLLIRRLPHSGNTPAIQSLLLLFGVWLVLQNIGYYIWGGDTKAVLTGYTLRSLRLGPVSVGWPIVLVFLVGVLSLAVLHLVMSRTYLGKAIRAVTQNPGSAQLVGINSDRINMIAFGLGIGLAGISGSMVSTLYAFTPDFGRNLLLKSFCIIVLGGMESFAGVAAGAVVVALVEAYAAQYLVSSVFQDVVTYSLLVLTLIFLPRGLHGLSGRRLHLPKKVVPS